MKPKRRKPTPKIGTAYVIPMALAGALLVIGTFLFASPGTRNASVGFLVAAPILGAATTLAIGVRRPRRWMSVVMAGGYLLVALWELIPWQRRPFWSALVLALVIGVSVVLWLRLVTAPPRTPTRNRRVHG
jgi:hypothetical protein